MPAQSLDNFDKLMAIGFLMNWSTTQEYEHKEGGA